MKLTYRITIFFANLLVIFFCTCQSSYAEEKKVKNFKFTYQDLTSKEVWVTKIDILGDKNISQLKIPSEINGKKVVKLGAKYDPEDDFVESHNIFGIYRSEDDEIIRPKKTIKKVANIKQIVMPSTVTAITPNCFRLVQDGKTINIPRGLTKNILYLCEIKWGKFTISSKNKMYKVSNKFILSKNGKKVYGFAGPGNKLDIPNGVKTIAKEAFVGARIKNISLPKSVNKIETGAFNYIKSARFKISKKNLKYGTSNNCIYSKKSGRLVVAATIKDIISIPDQVTCLKEGTSFPGKSIKKIIFPVSLKKIGKYWNSSLLCEKNVELVFKGKKPPEIDATAYLPFSKVYVPKNKKSGFEKAFKRFVDNGDILIHAY